MNDKCSCDESLYLRGRIEKFKKGQRDFANWSLKQYNENRIKSEWIRKQVDLESQLSDALKRIGELERWIPVSERVPEKNVDVITNKGYGFYDSEGWVVSKDFKGEPMEDFYEDKEITKWKPLPSPPEAQEERDVGFGVSP